MKLISCYIAHFGKIKEFSYNFDEGLILLSENILQRFLKKMDGVRPHFLSL